MKPEPITKTKINIKKICMEWGIGLIIAGIIPFVFSGLLDTTIGVIALLLGVFTLVFRKSWNIAIIGAFVILIGAWNIIIVLVSQTQYIFLIVGIVQIVMGVGALNQYHKIDKKEVSNKRTNWFKRHSILVIILSIFIVLIIMGIFNYFNSSLINDKRIGDLDNAKAIKTQIEFLEDDGYEVLYFYYSLENTSLESGYLEMKSLGNQNEQVWRGLIALYQVYPNAPEYTINILEPTRDCYYDISGNLYRNWLTSSNAPDKKIIINGTEFDSLTIYQYINSEIEKDAKTCS